MRYHLFQKFFGKMVKIKETSFLSTRGAVCFALNCILKFFYSRLPLHCGLRGYEMCKAKISSLGQ